MKRYLSVTAALLAVSSLGAFAQSRNYEALTQNEDESVTIRTPRFNYLGETRRISSGSDLNGVCKLYGYEVSMPNSMEYDRRASAHTVAIGASGKMTNSNHGHYPIRVLLCSKQNVNFKPSTFAQGIYKNDDGSVTIQRPRFGREGLNRRISAGSELNGVCKHFGLGQAIPNTLEYDREASSATVYIASNARSASINHGHYPIEILACENALNTNVNIPSNSERSSSGNRDALYENEDGTFTIIRPRFSYLGDTRRISAGSDLNGVCRLNGFANAIGNTLEYDRKASARTVALNAAGKLVSSNHGHYPVETLICTKNERRSKPSRFLSEIARNDDGSVTLVEPKYGKNGLHRRISAGSDLNGVCDLYGFGEAVTGTLEYNRAASSKTVAISGEGIVSNINHGHYPIQNLVCRSRVSQRMVSTDAASITTNDDGSKTILRPMFGDGTFRRRISAGSDLDGVCRLYGFNRSVLQEYDRAASAITIAINSDGMIVNSNHGHYPISILVCE